MPCTTEYCYCCTITWHNRVPLVYVGGDPLACPAKTTLLTKLPKAAELLIRWDEPRRVSNCPILDKFMKLQ